MWRGADRPNANGKRAPFPDRVCDQEFRELRNLTTVEERRRRVAGGPLHTRPREDDFEDDIFRCGCVGFCWCKVDRFAFRRLRKGVLAEFSLLEALDLFGDYDDDERLRLAAAEGLFRPTGPRS